MLVGVINKTFKPCFRLRLFTQPAQRQSLIKHRFRRLIVIVHGRNGLVITVRRFFKAFYRFFGLSFTIEYTTEIIILTVFTCTVKLALAKRFRIFEGGRKMLHGVCGIAQRQRDTRVNVLFGDLAFSSLPRMETPRQNQIERLAVSAQKIKKRDAFEIQIVPARDKTGVTVQKFQPFRCGNADLFF